MAKGLYIEGASDWGGAHPDYPASNAIDGSTDWSSPWAAEAGGEPVNLVLNLGLLQYVAIPWGKGDVESYKFEIRALADENSSDWIKVYNGNSSSSTTDFESYDISDIEARWIRVKVFSNSAGSEWTNITEVKISGDGSFEAEEL